MMTSNFVYILVWHKLRMQCFEVKHEGLGVAKMSLSAKCVIDIVLSARDGLITNQISVPTCKSLTKLTKIFLQKNFKSQTTIVTTERCEVSKLVEVVFILCFIVIAVFSMENNNVTVTCQHNISFVLRALS